MSVPGDCLSVQRIRERERQVLPQDALEVGLADRRHVLDADPEPGADPLGSRRRDCEAGGSRLGRASRRLGTRRQRRGDRRGCVGPARNARHLDTETWRNARREHGRADPVQVHPDRPRRSRGGIGPGLGIPILKRDPVPRSLPRPVARPRPPATLRAPREGRPSGSPWIEAPAARGPRHLGHHRSPASLLRLPRRWRPSGESPGPRIRSGGSRPHSGSHP